jgi:isoquinoline 1-oxidoreductase beta subunit
VHTLPTSRRQFLIAGGAAAGGLVLGLALPLRAARGSAAGSTGAAIPTADVNAFVRIGEDGSVTLIVPKSEMGQGVYTGYAQLLAEELEVDWQSIRIESAPVASVYNVPGTPVQYTGGSSSIPSGFKAMREAGAAARSLLIGAAAHELDVPAGELAAEGGFVLHRPTGRRLGYGALASRAATLPPPGPVALKEPGTWRLIGKPMPRIDARAKTTGAAGFGLDVRLPGLHYAMVARAPSFGATVASVDATAAHKVPGVVAIVQVPSGVAVIASNTWAAQRGREALRIKWQDGPAAGFSTSALAKDYAARAATPGALARAVGDIAHAGAAPLAADYLTPYLAHAPLEPLNCTVAFADGGCDVYTGTQSQSFDRMAAAEVAGLPPERVHIHTTYLGGGFGRRASSTMDFVREAVAVAKAFPKPVMTVWSREDDIRGGHYRPQAHNRLTATFTPNGRPATWTHTQVVQSLLKGTPFEKMGVDPVSGIDFTTVEGAAEVPYAIENIRIEVHDDPQPVPVQWWRSVGHSNTAFAVESFIDECAYAMGADPFAYRLALLKGHPRHLATLQLAADKAGWDTPPPAGRARGIAVHESFGSVVAEVAEVSLEDGRPRVHRVVAAIHCGIAVNPNLIAQQLESAVTYGLSAALYGAITIEKGRVEQSNFNDYEILRFAAAPVVEAYIVPSTDPPTGVGEPGTPPVAPALANALFALTRIRVRRLPMRHADFKKALI